MGRRDRRFEADRHAVQHGRCRGLGRETLGRIQIDDAAAQGAHDAPSAGVGAEGDRRSSGHDDPQRNVGAFVVPAGDKCQHDDAHRLLGILHKSQNARFMVAASSVRLAGLLTKTGGILTLQSANLQKGAPLATLNWTGVGALSQRAIGLRGYVQFRHGGTPDVKPTRQILAPFKDNFGDNDGFWYGEANSNMRFDVDGKEGRDEKGNVFFGSVNTNAGTPDDGPRNSFKIEVTDSAKHLLTIFSPASGATGASQNITLTAADGSTQTVRLDGTQGGVVVQFEFIGNVTLTLQQNFGGMGAPRPGASAAALFFD